MIIFTNTSKYRQIPASTGKYRQVPTISKYEENNRNLVLKKLPPLLGFFDVRHNFRSNFKTGYFCYCATPNTWNLTAPTLSTRLGKLVLDKTGQGKAAVQCWTRQAMARLDKAWMDNARQSEAAEHTATDKTTKFTNQLK